MPDPLPDGLYTDYDRIIAETIARRKTADPIGLTIVIVERLWDAGYEIAPRPDLIPIRYNPTIPPPEDD